MEERGRNMDKLKHDHRPTDKLKVLVFSIILLAPFLAIASECLIAIFNENSQLGADTFYNAVDHLATKPIFNWTINTGIYTTINAMTTGLEFGTSANTLAIILTYISLNVAVYVVFDIILYLFTRLTHFTIN